MESRRGWDTHPWGCLCISFTTILHVFPCLSALELSVDSGYYRHGSWNISLPVVQ